MAGAAVLVLSSIVGWIVSGAPGLGSGALGAGIGILFPIITVATLLFGNRWYGTPSFLTMFFAVNAGSFLVKIVVFMIALNIVFGLPWVDRIVLYGALVAAALASLVVDVIVVARTRISGASDVALPERGEGDELPEERD
ncbi:hypothetical protein CIK77_16175 [Microbacterium sp. JB110]|nr:hypothetical protein CIK77_16175 [Microbacterium sp. JB110]